MKKRKRRELERDFCGVANKERVKEAFKSCNHHIGYFYLYQLFGRQLSLVEAEELQLNFVKGSGEDLVHGDRAHLACREAKEFFDHVIAKMPKMNQFTDKFLRVFKALIKDNANEVKSFSDDNVPPEALFLIKGLEIPGYTISPFAKSTDSIPIDTRDMSLLEVACCTQKMKVVKMMTETLNMRNSRDFLDDRRNKSIQE